MPQFRQVNGLTAYSFACGYIQRAELKLPDRNVQVDLHKDGCWHIKRLDWGGPRGLTTLNKRWETTTNLQQARLVWEDWVKETFKDELLQMAKDHRYTYTREFHGEAEQSWITRFCGEWVGNAETRLQARLKAYQHWFEHVKPATERPVTL